MRCKDMHMMVATSKVCEFVGGEDRTNAGSRTEKEPASVYMFKSPHIDWSNVNITISLADVTIYDWRHERFGKSMYRV